MEGIEYKMYSTYGGADKPAIILDIGEAYCKCGFAGEAQPRHILPTEFFHVSTKQPMHFYNANLWDDVSWLDAIETFLNTLYFKWLLVTPIDRKVVLVENMLMPSSIREAFAQVFFCRFKIPELSVYPLLPCVLVFSKSIHGLVIDVGYSEARVLPIVDGRCLTHAYNVSPGGAKTILDHLSWLLRQNPDNSEDISVPRIDLENILVRGCIAVQDSSEAMEDIKYKLEDTSIVQVSSDVRRKAVDVLFNESENENTLSILILDCILKCPVDVRTVLIRNLTFVGGITSMTGFIARAISEMKLVIQSNPRYRSLQALAVEIDINPVQSPLILGWLGASILSSIDLAFLPHHKSIDRQNYINKSQCLPDWLAVAS